MTLGQDFLKIITNIASEFELPSVDKIYIPVKDKLTIDHKKANFGAIKLTDGSTGIFFVGLHPDFHKIAEKTDLKSLIEENILKLASKFNSQNLFERTIGLGIINAISHFVFTQFKFQFDNSNNILDLMNIQSDDFIGMVGYFPPLVRKLKNITNQFIVVELKKELINKFSDWEITLDKTKLRDCNKIICTSTTIINNTLDDVLKYTQNTEFFALIGPTAGFLPDPLFTRNIDVIGGSVVNNSELFFNRITQGERWGDSVSKFAILRKDYLGFQSLIERARSNKIN